MCGICGFVGFEDKNLLKDMTKSLAHRGPNGSGFFIDKNVSLGHRRLSIIDLKTGKQPMHNEDGTIQVIFNGEIYNFKELKGELEKKHKFYTNSDTEVIVHAYEEYGVDCLKKFNGCFAFAIWDSTKKRLFLARDRLGIKPLFYTKIGDRFLFASEIKSILHYKEIVRKVNLRALHDFLTFRCVSIEDTMFDGIKKLMPAHYLIFEKNKLTKTRYWDLKYNTTKNSEQYFEKNLFEVLKKSVNYRLMSEVPLGAYLSGGIDSSTLVALMAQLKKEPVKTLSVGFDIPGHEDELKYAKIIAEHFNTDHTEVIVRPDASKLFPKLVWHLDEPMSDPTVIPTYLLASKTRPKCTVVLTGEGGDENLGGYVQYKMMLLHKKYARIFPKAIRKSVYGVATILPKDILNRIFKYAGALGEEGLKRFNEFITTDDYGKMYLSLVSIFNEAEKRELYNKKTQEKTKNMNLIKELNNMYFSKSHFSNNRLLNTLTYMELKRIMPENLLMKTDKMTMAFGVEGRVPFLDHNVVEFTAKIPLHLKLKGFNEKYILRKAMSRYLPKTILRRKKQRFFVPIDSWFKGDLQSLMKQALSKENIKSSGVFNQRYIEKVFKNYKKSQLFYARQLWGLFTFQIWHKMFIEDFNPKKPNLNIDRLL